MKSNSTKKLALAGVLCAVAVAGSMFLVREVRKGLQG